MSSGESFSQNMQDAKEESRNSYPESSEESPSPASVKGEAISASDKGEAISVVSEKIVGKVDEDMVKYVPKQGDRHKDKMDTGRETKRKNSV